MIPDTPPKYEIDDAAFSIQRMKRSGYSKMPRPHVHDFYELYYLLSGERVYFMNGSVYLVRKGDLVFVSPGDLHSTASSEVLEFERVLIHVSAPFLADPGARASDLLSANRSGLIRFSIKEQARVERLLLQMMAECEERQPDYDICVRASLLELLVCIRRAERQQHRPSPQADAHPMHQKISEIAAYIHEHYPEPITLESVAKTFYISPSYLSRVFVKLTGFHFREYIQVVRVREAEKRLKQTKDKVQAIAEQVGFEHIAHFNRIFKKQTGLSPLRYRKHS
ncbi:helix-turn-helix transcriptional regulator [Paenibacillus sp. GYB003]|uniref:helix-turn-helix transcriptional regulator n=1 Tax=Paenibacillus sp. GYB003 TaxID=2994392 RepID=UPI002F967A7C